MEGIKNLIIDLGGVLINLTRNRCIEAFENLGVENIREQITNNYQHKDLFERLELGTISVEQFRDDIRALSGKPLTDEQIDTAWIAMLGDVPENKLRLLLELRERYNTMLLSNTNELHWKWSEDTYFSYQGLCAQDFFHKIYLSYELHMLKPNADIFEYVVEIARNRDLFHGLNTLAVLQQIPLAQQGEIAAGHVRAGVQTAQVGNH